MPLGVCVNCAAPIAKGLYAGGARAETTLAAMIASPTLNIVVLTMLFGLFPFYMALTKHVVDAARAQVTDTSHQVGSWTVVSLRDSMSSVE